MLRSDISRKTHANYQNYFFVRNVFFQYIDVKSTSISRKIEVHIESNFHFSVSIDVFKHSKCNKHKYKISLGV